MIFCSRLARKDELWFFEAAAYFGLPFHFCFPRARMVNNDFWCQQYKNKSYSLKPK